MTGYGWFTKLDHARGIKHVINFKDIDGLPPFTMAFKDPILYFKICQGNKLMRSIVFGIGFASTAIITYKVISDWHFKGRDE